MRVSSTVLALASAGGIDGVLGGLKGKSDVDCGEVCTAYGGSYMGYGMSSSGDVATWNCNCGSAGKKPIACVGSPFIQCCEEECSAGKCGDTPGGWECPADGGCPGGGCSGDQWENWVAAHNVYRCMHDIPPVVWDMDVYQDCYDTFKDQSAMEHSHCYDVPAPAGPAGENLFKASYDATPIEATAAWYSEIAECGPFPGCVSGASGTTGHFTAMSWNGDKEIGCAFAQGGLIACRYKAQDFASCETPNYGGDASYPQNIFPKVKDFSECVDAVKACGFSGFTDTKHTTIDPALGYDTSKVQVGANVGGTFSYVTSPLCLGAGVAVVGVLSLFARSKATMLRAPVTEQDDGLLEEAELEDAE
jgi:hypothetical protein